MSRLVGAFVEGSPSLIFPLAALLAFVVIFAVAVVRVWLRRDGHYARMERLPLDEENGT